MDATFPGNNGSYNTLNGATDESVWWHILVDQSRDGIVVVNQDGGVFFVNQQFANMLGYTKEEAVREASRCFHSSAPCLGLGQKPASGNASGDDPHR